MQIYRHTQVGTHLLWILGVSAVLVGAILFWQIGDMMTVAAVSVVLVVSMILFASLTVEVTHREISFAFGPGWLRMRYALSRIADARAVRNPWYYGLGIHYTSDGWVFNVAGLDAVELELESGRKIRIGTDEPDRLAAAIHQAIDSHHTHRS